MTWQRLSVRVGQESPADIGPFEGIPDHISEPLTDWLDGALADDSSFMLKISNAIRLPLKGVGIHPKAMFQELRSMYDDDPNLFLNIIDATLYYKYSKTLDMPYYAAGDLKDILEIGGSAWAVADDGKSLERRVEPLAKEAARMAMSPGDPASDELQQAWQAVYGRDPNPSDGWDHGIKALEALLIPLVVPSQAKPTLGHVIGQLRTNRPHWKLALPGNDSDRDIATLVSMLDLLWPNPDRHANINSREPTLAETQAALHLTITIAQWAREGVITRR